jgi:hypothetical protein
MILMLVRAFFGQVDARVNAAFRSDDLRNGLAHCGVLVLVGMVEAHYSAPVRVFLR